MSDLELHQPPKPITSLPLPSKNAKLERVTGKVRAAIEAMVWDGLPRTKAAEKAGISEHGLYKALRKPPVKAAYLAELEVLRTSERARDIHTLNEIRDQTGNQMARVQAVKAKWQLDEVDNVRSSANSLPGLQIVIVQGGAATQVSTTGAMTIEHDSSGSHKPSD